MGACRSMAPVSAERVQFRIHGEHPPRAVEFDPAWRAVYLRLRDGDVVRSEELAEGVVLDRGAAGEILGVEIVGLGVARCEAVLRDLRSAYLEQAPELASVEVVAA